MNRVQFQKGISPFELFERFGTEAHCQAALEQASWPQSFCCPRCGSAAHSVLRGRARKTFRCIDCHHQTSVIADTLFAGTVVFDGLACFGGVPDIGCTHGPTVVGDRKPKQLPIFLWVNTILGNLKTNFSGAYHAFGYSKYAEHYLCAVAYRFNRRFTCTLCRGRCSSRLSYTLRVQSAISGVLRLLAKQVFG